MDNGKIVLDFTQNKSMDALLAGQPLAIMPAALAKKLLQRYAASLNSSKASGIIRNHMDILAARADDNDLNGAIEASISWIQERDLIDNVVAGRWDAYEVKEEQVREVVA